MPIIAKKISKKCSSVCGDCKHFGKEKKFEDTCKNLGIIATSKAPSCYIPDLSPFRKVGTLPNIENLGGIIKDLSAKQCRILANILIQQSKIKDNDFYIGQPLYVCLGEEYLSHYYKAFLINYDASTGYVSLVSRLKNCKTATSIAFHKDSVLNQLQFNEKALELSQSGRIVRDKKELEHFRNLPISDKLDKRGLIDISKLIRLDLDVDVPTIDKAPKDVFEKKKKVKDLSEIFGEVMGNIPKVTKLKTKRG